jgi:hypothetical protein
VATCEGGAAPGDWVEGTDARVHAEACTPMEVIFLRHGARQLWTMLVARPDIADALADSTVRVGIMGVGEGTLDMPEWSDLEPEPYGQMRWLGAKLERPLVGGGEENVGCHPQGDVEQEYFAQGVQSFFDANQAEDGSIHNHVDTRDELRSYDAALFTLVTEVYSDTTWRPRCPDGRTRAETRASSG